MTNNQVPGGTVHKLPADLHSVLLATPKMLAMWQDITPLARNEFICWIEDAKKNETRERRIKIARDKLLKGERRPCCWIGCTHRADKPMSASQKYILGDISKKRT